VVAPSSLRSYFSFYVPSWVVFFLLFQICVFYSGYGVRWEFRKRKYKTITPTKFPQTNRALYFRVCLLFLFFFLHILWNKCLSWWIAFNLKDLLWWTFCVSFHICTEIGARWWLHKASTLCLTGGKHLHVSSNSYQYSYIYAKTPTFPLVYYHEEYYKSCWLFDNFCEGNGTCVFLIPRLFRLTYLKGSWMCLALKIHAMTRAIGGQDRRSGRCRREM